MTAINGYGGVVHTPCQASNNQSTTNNEEIPPLDNIPEDVARGCTLPPLAGFLGDILMRIGYAVGGIVLAGASVVLVPVLAVLALPVAVWILYPRNHTQANSDAPGFGLGMLLFGVISPALGAYGLLQKAVL